MTEGSLIGWLHEVGDDFGWRLSGAYAGFDIGGCLILILCARKILTTTPT